MCVNIIGVIGKGQKAGQYTVPLRLFLHLFCPVVSFSEERNSLLHTSKILRRQCFPFTLILKNNLVTTGEIFEKQNSFSEFQNQSLRQETK